MRRNVTRLPPLKPPLILVGQHITLDRCAASIKVFELLSACKTNMRNLTFAASMPMLLSNEDASLEVFRTVFSAIKEVYASSGGVSFARNCTVVVRKSPDDSFTLQEIQRCSISTELHKGSLYFHDNRLSFQRIATPCLPRTTFHALRVKM